MAYPVTLNGRTYTLADFEGTNYVDGFPDALEDFVTQAGNIYTTTSTSSVAIGSGSKTFTVADSGKPYIVGTPLRISDTAAPTTNWIDGIVTSYSGTTLIVDAVAYAGSGTISSWNINIGGGPIAYTGTLPIAQGGTGATTAADARTNLDVYSKSEADGRYINVTGDGMTSDLTFGDNVKTTFGADSDLQIYHDGTNSYIDDAGTGTMRLRGFNQVRITDLSDNIAAIFKGDAEQTLYHNNSAKLATTSTGVDVTGTITADGLTLDSTGELKISRVGSTTSGIYWDRLGTQDAQIKVLDTEILTIDNNFGQPIDFRTGAVGSEILHARINGAGDISFYDTSGNAKFFWDASAESLGIGLSAPTEKFHIAQNTASTAVTAKVENNSATSGANAVLNLDTVGNSFSIINYPDADTGNANRTDFYSNAGGSYFTFSPSNSEAARLDSNGNLLVGTTNSDPALNNVSGVAAEPEGRIQASRLGAVAATFNRQSSDGAVVQFRKDASVVGTVSVTASATSYNTSSDYRLKEDVQPMTGASERVLALNPVNFAWKSDGSRVDGFLAHEAQAVVPEAVHGEKDEVDEDGNPVYQGIDQSKLVPLLTAALQEALNKIDDLETRVAALEAK